MEELVTQTTFIAFDFETTGLNASNDRIIEFGAVMFTTRGVVSTFHTYANPGIKVPHSAQLIHNISDQDLKNKPSVHGAVQDFFHYIGDHVLIAHNANFDLEFLHAELRRANQALLVHNKIIDTLALAKRTFPREKSYRLGNLITSFNLPDRKKHNALEDAYSCKDLFLYIVHHLSFFGELALRDCL